MSPSKKKKPTKYYVDFENVHGAGLKGIDELDKDDVVLVFYSQAAETFHIEQAIDILKSRARVEFVEIDGGTRNSLDFQLVTALYGMMDDQHEYAIVSGDGGFDAAIKMGERLELQPVRRITDLTGSTEQPPAKKSSRTRRRSTAVKEPESAPASEAAATPNVEVEAATSDASATTSARSGRYSKRKEIKALLADNGVALNQQQLSTVMKALNGVKNRQSFYRAIIQLEKQERGLELYRKVRDYYEAMVDILRS